VHLLAGTWIANLDKSRRDPNHQFHRATIRFEVAGDVVSIAYGGVNASGRDEQGAQRLTADGQEHPLAEAPGLVAVSTLERCVLRTVATKDGAVMGRAAYEVSEDGKTLTATVSGRDGTGTPFEQRVVFDREESRPPRTG
jgi:hypothetical protein